MVKSSETTSKTDIKEKKMILLKNRKELEKAKSSLPKELHQPIENDLKIIEEEMPKYDDDFVNQYGPIVVVYDTEETEQLLERMPVIKQLESEYEDIVFQDDKTTITKRLFLLTEAGIITYERRGENVR